jgi:transitional endoplasmic reticulum ATPase
MLRKIRSSSRRKAASGTRGGERRRLLDILCALHGTVRRRSPDAGALIRCVVQAQGHLGLPDNALPAPLRQDGDVPVSSAEWVRLGAALKTKRTRLAVGESYLDTWLPSLSETIALDDVETAILGLAIAYGQDGYIERLWDEMSSNRGRTPLLRDDPELFGLMLGLLEVRVRSCLAPDGRLRASGLLAVDEDGDITVLRRLSGLLARRIPLEGDVRGLLLGPPRPAELPWHAFKHLGEIAETAATVLAAAIEKREPGVGILLYGPPGTGKTAFAAALAARVGAALHPVGEADAEGEEPSRGERLAELRLNQRLLGDAASVLLFDEAEDLFASSPFFESQTRSRVFIHRLLEQGRAPVIWTANDIEILGPTIARRMMLCIEVRRPGCTVRADLWRDMAISEKVSLSEADAAELARAIPAAPAILRNALRATRLANGDSKTARLVATGIARAVAGGQLPLPEPAVDARYDPSLVQADCDLAALAARLTRPGAPLAVSLLLSGPPGSGKSAYARYLATQMGMPVLLKRASDLLGPYVGQSEQQIASAFSEARETAAFLILDEADSLLGDRRGAQRSWEVSQVNEMLTWMESHPLPFACTTNLIDRIDPASMRRFLIKARFSYLSPTQVRAAFARFFGVEAPAEAARLEQLTPADFAVVSRHIILLDRPAAPKLLMDMLIAESAGRESSRRIGFAA